MESASAPRGLRVNRADKEKEKDNGSSSGKEKTNFGGDEKGVKVSPKHFSTFHALIYVSDHS